MAQDEAMIAFLPSDGTWCKQDFPHMTLVSAGKTADRPESDLNEMAKDAINAARIVRGGFSLNVTGIETMGENEKVDVLMLYPTPQLLVARDLVKKWETEFPDFKAHATIGPEGSAFATDAPNYTNYDSPSRRSTLPSSLYFDRIAVCWDDKKLVFNLSSFDY